jgi:HlyD family secretion protein
MRKLVLACVVMGVVGIGVILLKRASETRHQEALRSAEVLRVNRRDIGSVVKATEVIKPTVGAEVRVGSSVSGVVKRLYVRIGDTAEKGQLLAELDDRELVARHDVVAAAVQLSRGFSCSKLFIVVLAPSRVMRMALCMNRAAVT